jgi:hypothetical protein
VLAGATVRRTTEADGSGLGDGAGPTITVGVDREVSIETVVNATRAAEVTVVRVTGTVGAPLDPTTDRYRAEHDLDPDTPSATTEPETGPTTEPDGPGPVNGP